LIVTPPTNLILYGPGTIVAGGGQIGVRTGNPDPYVLIIDEINRADVSKVFGELIALLEP
jgi:5-methylcytosine-specific restriction protein B